MRGPHLSNSPRGPLGDSVDRAHAKTMEIDKLAGSVEVLLAAHQVVAEYRHRHCRRVGMPRKGYLRSISAEGGMVLRFHAIAAWRRSGATTRLISNSSFRDSASRSNKDCFSIGSPGFCDEGGGQGVYG